MQTIMNRSHRYYLFNKLERYQPYMNERRSMSEQVSGEAAGSELES